MLILKGRQASLLRESDISAASMFNNRIANPVPAKNDADVSHFQAQIETPTVSRPSAKRATASSLLPFHPFPLNATPWSAQGESRAAQPPSGARRPLTRPSTPTDSPREMGVFRKQPGPSMDGIWLPQIHPLILSGGSHFACVFERTDIHSLRPILRRTRRESDAARTDPHR